VFVVYLYWDTAAAAGLAVGDATALRLLTDVSCL